MADQVFRVRPEALGIMADRVRAAVIQAASEREVEVVIQEPRRNLDQSARFHAMCSDTARSTLFLGRKLTQDQWKVLFISGHAIATNRGADMVPGLEGEFVNIRESTARMSKARMSSLIEYVTAWCVDNEVPLGDHATADYESYREARA